MGRTNMPRESRRKRAKLTRVSSMSDSRKQEEEELHDLLQNKQIRAQDQVQVGGILVCKVKG